MDKNSRDMNKTFKITPGEEIPPRATDQDAKSHNFSDRYFAKVETVSGSIKSSIVSWDFKLGAWKSPVCGLNRVIEYYVEV